MSTFDVKKAGRELFESETRGNGSMLGGTGYGFLHPREQAKIERRAMVRAAFTFALEEQDLPDALSLLSQALTETVVIASEQGFNGSPWDIARKLIEGLEATEGGHG
jgi:hypothetical protein